MSEKTKSEGETAVDGAGKAAPTGPGFRMAPASAPVDDSFADGVSGFTVGRNVLKLDLYRIVGYDRETGQEVRTHSHRLVLPLTAISELSTVLKQFDTAVSQLRSSQQKQDGAGAGAGNTGADVDRR